MCAGRKKRGSRLSDAQQAVARQAHRLRRGLGEVTVAVERRKRSGEPVARVDAVLVPEVGRANRAQLELEHKLSNEPLLVGRAVGAVQRNASRLHRRGIGVPGIEVLHVHAVDVSERRHAQSGQVGALPQAVAVDELRAPRILDRRVGAADGVSGLFQRGERFVHPAPLGGPGRDGFLELAGAVQAVAADRRVERQLHLVDGDAVGVELDRPAHRLPPFVFGLAQHAGDQVDVDLRETDGTRVAVRPEDLCGAVRAPVQFQDVVVEMLDAETEPRDAHPANRAELRLGERPGLALERDLARGRPRRDRRQAINETLELPDRQERRRAAAEIDEVERPPGDGRLPGVQLPLPPQNIEVRLDLGRVLVPCRPGSSRSGSACGRTECGGTGRAGHPRAARRAPGGPPRPPPPASRPRTADSWRRNSCRLPFRPRLPPSMYRSSVLLYQPPGCKSGALPGSSLSRILQARRRAAQRIGRGAAARFSHVIGVIRWCPCRTRRRGSVTPT